MSKALAEVYAERAIHFTRVARKYNQLRLDAMKAASDSLKSMDALDRPESGKLRLKSLWLDEYMKGSE